MATTEYALNHPMAVKLWSRKLVREALKQTYASKFMGKTSNSLIYIKDDTSKGPGDKITCGLRMQLSGAGVSGDGTLEGNEEALTVYNDNVTINQLRHAVRTAGKMSEQRVPFSLREEARVGLTDWWSDRIDTWFANCISGNTGQADTRYTGLQATTAPTSASGNTRIIYADGNSTTEGSLSAVQTFQLTYIDRALAQAKTSTPLIRPVKTMGGEYFVAFLHPYQVHNLRTDATAARVTWYDAQKARIQGGVSGETESPIFNGALGVYNGVVLHEWTRLPVSPDNASVRRAVLCGAQSALMAFGQDANQSDKPNWQEEMFDYGNQFGVAGGMIAGMKKAVYNSIDFGTIVIPTYAVAP